MKTCIINKSKRVNVSDITIAMKHVWRSSWYNVLRAPHFISLPFIVIDDGATRYELKKSFAAYAAIINDSLALAWMNRRSRYAQSKFLMRYFVVVDENRTYDP